MIREQTIQESLTEIGKCKSNESLDAVCDGLNVLLKLINNLISNHREEKYRTLNLANQTVKAKVMTLKPENKLMLMLEMIGYVKSN